MSYPLPPPGPAPQPGPPPQPGPRHRSAPAPGRRGEPRAEPVPAPEDVELDSYLAALAPTTDDPSLTGGFGHAQVFQLRLPALRIEQLRRIAQERGVSP